MKKLVFMFVAMAAISFASCGEGAGEQTQCDSCDTCGQDTTVVADTVAVDTAAVDTTAQA